MAFTNSKSSTLPNAMHICIRIITFRKTLIQIQANLFKMFFPQISNKPNIICLQFQLDLPEKISHVGLTSKTEKKRLKENKYIHKYIHNINTKIIYYAHIKCSSLYKICKGLSSTLRSSLTV